MFFNPDFTFEHAGEEYAQAGQVTQQQMGELGENFGTEHHAPSLPPGEERPYLVHALQAEPLPKEKRAALDQALAMAKTPAEKTSLLQWAAAGGETAFRFTTLSAKTGADMFFNPDFTFEHAGKDYAQAGQVTQQQMFELGENFGTEHHAPSMPPGQERPYFIHA